MKVLIAGDFSIQHRATKMVWNKENMEKAFCKVREMTSGCDYAIVNLESPITTNDRALLKDGPALKNAEEAISIIKYCGFNIVTLANNHLKDYRDEGVIDTIDSCKREGLMITGAANNIENARKPLILKGDDIVVGILNVCEHESSIATHKNAGAAPYDLVNLYHDIKELKKVVDKVIVIIHGGCEHYQLPTPRMKREYRLISEFGADIIINHHQHCFSGYESYNNSIIFYGLGNFFFDNPRKRNDKWNNGLMLILDIGKEKADFQIIPIIQCDEESEVKICQSDNQLNEITKLNNIIVDDEALNKSFSAFVSKQKPIYPFLPYGNHYLRALYNRGWMPKCLSPSREVKIENSISCESHREVLLNYFEKELHDE